MSGWATRKGEFAAHEAMLGPDAAASDTGNALNGALSDDDGGQ